MVYHASITSSCCPAAHTTSLRNSVHNKFDKVDRLDLLASTACPGLACRKGPSTTFAEMVPLLITALPLTSWYKKDVDLVSSSSGSVDSDNEDDVSDSECGRYSKTEHPVIRDTNRRILPLPKGAKQPESVRVRERFLKSLIQPGHLPGAKARKTDEERLHFLQRDPWVERHCRVHNASECPNECRRWLCHFPKRASDKHPKRTDERARDWRPGHIATGITRLSHVMPLEGLALWCATHGASYSNKIWWRNVGQGRTKTRRQLNRTSCPPTIVLSCYGKYSLHSRRYAALRLTGRITFDDARTNVTLSSCVYVILKVFPVSMSCLLPTDRAGAADDQPQVYFCTQAVYPALAALYVRCAPRFLLDGHFRHLAFEFDHEMPRCSEAGYYSQAFPRSLEGPRRNAMKRLVDFVLPLPDSGESGPNIEASLLLQAPVKPSVKLPEGEFCRGYSNFVNNKAVLHP
ncbi:hypothetical protein EDD85DRAFT_794418 [Armillaria nabsnona]|nr:hypothetical protein EDD85DRAFT_794418 [Armillaria nabsnona]